MATGEAVPDQVVASMGSQIDLLFTLAVALCGGIIALVFQIAIHNKKTRGTAVLRLRGVYFMFFAFFMEGLSVLFGYFSRGSITANIPSIYRLDFSMLEVWKEASFDGFATLTFLMEAQFWTFILGILLLFVSVICNRNQIVGIAKK